MMATVTTTTKKGGGGEEIKNMTTRNLVSWCFKPRQPRRITSGLSETFIKRCIVERASTAEMRPEEQSEEAESCRGKLLKEIQLKAQKTEMDTRTK